jgi:hypothetical protein
MPPFSNVSVVSHAIGHNLPQSTTLFSSS